MTSNIKILIVDDEPQQLETIVRVFEEFQKDYIIYRAFNGKVALRIAEKELPNLIITDWDMPEIDGIGLIKALKNEDNTKDIPVIMCSGVMISSANLNTALEAGAADYIRKPLDPIELIARTRSMLNLADGITKIKALNAEKDKFFGIVAHDLRNPFQALLGFSKILQTNYDNYSDEKRKYFIDAISQSAQSAYRFLENLLTWSRSQRNTMPFYPGTFDFRNLVDSIHDSMYKTIEEKQLTVTYKNITSEMVYADREMVTTILRNILSNAIKYSHPESTILLNATSDSSHVKFSVQDYGLGISEENINKLFRIDVNYSTPGTNREMGTGLGLIISQELLHLNNGTISVESKLGEGSTFSITIPLKEQQKEA